MQCPRCGKENPDSSQICHSCSCLLTGTSTKISNPNVKTSRLAVTSFVLALLGLCPCFILITIIPAVICGIFALVKVKKSTGQLKGKNLAIAGIIISCISLPLPILMPALVSKKSSYREMMCGSNMSGLGKAMFIYAGDNNNTLPTHSKWCDLLMENTDISMLMFRCMDVSEGPCNYAMNKNIKNIEANFPPDIVLLFETHPGWNQFGGPEILSLNHLAHKACNVLFTDGHVKLIRKKDVHKLKWGNE